MATPSPYLWFAMLLIACVSSGQGTIPDPPSPLPEVILSKISGIQHIVYLFDGFKQTVRTSYPRDSELVLALDDMRDAVVDIVDTLRVLADPVDADPAAFELDGEHFQSLAMDTGLLENDWRVQYIHYTDTAGDQLLDRVDLRLTNVSPFHNHHRYLHLLVKWPVLLQNRWDNGLCIANDAGQTLQRRSCLLYGSSRDLKWSYGYGGCGPVTPDLEPTTDTVMYRPQPVPHGSGPGFVSIHMLPWLLTGGHANLTAVIFSTLNPMNPTYLLTVDLVRSDFVRIDQWRKLDLVLWVLNGAEYHPYNLDDREGKLRVLRITSGNSRCLNDVCAPTLAQ